MGVSLATLKDGMVDQCYILEKYEKIDTIAGNGTNIIKMSKEILICTDRVSLKFSCFWPRLYLSDQLLSFSPIYRSLEGGMCGGGRISQQYIPIDCGVSEIKGAHIPIIIIDI